MASKTVYKRWLGIIDQNKIEIFYCNIKVYIRSCNIYLVFKLVKY